MRSIPNSGYYLILIFQPLCSVLLWSHICLFALCWTKHYILFLFGGVASHTSHLLMSNPFVGLPLFVCLSVCLSPLSFPPSGYIPGYFPTRMSYPCWEHVSLLPPLTLSSSHTGCLTAPSTTCCMKAPVSTFTLVTKSVLVTVVGGLQGFVTYCIYTFVIMLPSLFVQ